MIRVRVVESTAELASLEPAWERLQESAAVTSVFETFDWQSLWFKTYGKGQPLRVLVAEDGDAMVGLLPLYVNTVALMRWPVRLLRFVGTGGDTSPDDLGPILAKGREDEVARALAKAALDLPSYDVLLLDDMLPGSPFPAALEAEARDRRLACRAGRSERIAFLELPATWDAFLASLHRDRRYRVRNVRKKLLAAHDDARFFVWTDLDTLDDGIDRLGFLHRKRWQRVGAPHGFRTPEYVGFHRDVMNACQRKDRLRLYALEAGGEIVAMYYFYRFRNRVYLMQSGFDPDRADVKPGQVLLGHVIEHAIGEKHEILDFLRGDHRYKEELASGERETVFVTVFRRSPGAWVYRTRRLYLPRLKAEAKKAFARVRTTPKKEDAG